MTINNQFQKVVVIGHQNPDTDSVCAAIAYADLKNRTDGPAYEARRAGNLNRETAFVLERFGFKPPRLCTDVYPKVRNVDYRHIAGISPSTSIHEAWEIMKEASIDTLAITDEEQSLLGIITMQDIAVSNMDVFDDTILSKTCTSIKNLLTTLSGTLVVGSSEGSVDPRGRVLIGTSSPDVLENTLQPGDIVILSNRYESQLCAIEMGVSMLIVCRDAPVTRSIQHVAAEHNVTIISVPYDTYAACKLISQCPPVSSCMQTEEIIKFSLLTTVENAVSVMAKVRHRYFPILDEDGKYCGMLSRRNVMRMEKRKVILVDHNEETQAVEGFDQANILEIVDHHRIGSLQTTGPVFFRNQPLGSTCSIITQMYEEQDLTLEPAMAGLLLSAILSDTLALTSPTTTPLDRVLARKLADIAQVDMDSYADEMFAAAENLEGRSGMDIVTQDFKMFTCGEIRFGVSQAYFLTDNNMETARALAAESMRQLRLEQNLEDIFVLLTDIRRSSSFVLCDGNRASSVLADAFPSGTISAGVIPTGENIDEDSPLPVDVAPLPPQLLEGVVSRKKQFLPRIMETYQLL